MKSEISLQELALSGRSSQFVLERWGSAGLDQRREWGPDRGGKPPSGPMLFNPDGGYDKWGLSAGDCTS